MEFIIINIFDHEVLGFFFVYGGGRFLCYFSNFCSPLQIDAAINSGNSGGPAFNDKGKCVGIAFQSLKHEDVENIGYVIPTPVILHFIQDYEKSGGYTGILDRKW